MCAAGLPAAAKDGTSIDFDPVGNEPIVTLIREHGMVRDLDETPLVRVYGDGRVHVHRPAYMRDAGHFEFRLAADELAALVAALEANGLTQFDRDAVRAARRAATSDHFVTLDATVTKIELNFARFASKSQAGGALERTIEWADPAIDAERFPAIPALAGLAAVERALLALTTDTRRRAVKAAGGQ